MTTQQYVTLNLRISRITYQEIISQLLTLVRNPYPQNRVAVGFTVLSDDSSLSVEQLAALI
jgi:inosine/xanthosine triphosphate pyrophosphatase family protein